MIEWLLKRFKYVRALEDHRRTYVRWYGMLEKQYEYLNEVYQKQLEIDHAKLTLDEAADVLSACVDYHEALQSLGAADPIQSRVLEIFEKYGIKVLRNEVADEWRRSKGFNEVIEETHGD